MDDIQYMRRALELAELGRGSVSPNPMVGCVIVRNDEIIGEGYHEKYGESHAEVNAINDVDDHELLKDSIAYVTLEPCAHYGKTPPCADLLVSKQVKRVVIACRDSFDQVDGKGIEKLKNGGIQTELGLLEKEAIDLNKRFFTFHSKMRPYVILKWAQTSDGFIARDNFDSKWISNSQSRQLVHKWRSQEDAILVGNNTAKHDNPSLTTRDWEGKNPVRILLDRNLEISTESNLFNYESETLIFNEKESKSSDTNEWIKVDSMEPDRILGELYKRKIQSVIIEGGSSVLNSFITNNCWDEARIFTSKTTFEKGIDAPILSCEPYSSEIINEDQLIIYRNPNG